MATHTIKAHREGAGRGSLIFRRFYNGAVFLNECGLPFFLAHMQLIGYSRHTTSHSCCFSNLTLGTQPVIPAVFLT
jgi:hypothetical protein